MSRSTKCFQRLYDEIWNQRKAFIRCHSGVPLLEPVLAQLAFHDVILVRDEYPRIWEYILSRRNAAIKAGRTDQEDLVINGQRGIGKSLFFYYALGAALQAHIPVVLYKNNDFCCIFDATGFSTFWFSRGDGFEVPPHTLYLFDCDRDIPSPPKLLLGRSGVLVQTGSPIHRTRWQWDPSGYTQFYMMDVWTRVEMQALQLCIEALSDTEAHWMKAAQDAEVYTPLELFDLLGPSPRQCLRYAGTQKTIDGPEADLGELCRAGIAWVDTNMYTLLHRPSGRPLPPELHEQDRLDGILALYKPEGALGSPTRAPEFHYAVPTLFLRGMFAAHIRAQWTVHNLHRITAAVLDLRPSLAPAFYQPLLVDYILETRAGRVCCVVDRNGDGDDTLATFRLGPGLELLGQAVEFDRGASEASQDLDIEDGCILVPRTGFTAFDAVVVSEDRTRVTMLRLAIGTQAVELDSTAIRAAVDLLDGLLPQPEAATWSFVHAGLDGDCVETLARNDVMRRKLESADPRLKAGWMRIGTPKKSTRAVLLALGTGIWDGNSPEERPAKRTRYPLE